ncbi:MAG: electron transfer flavoprotein-ubiquinone oxidoreductase [Gammaproteobacteria bacterium]
MTAAQQYTDFQQSLERESMEYDVVIVGAGPAGLSAAIRLKQLSVEHNYELSVCVLEKAAEVGAHILSGAVLEPRALNELLPNWQELGAPLNTPVTQDQFLWLTQNKAVKLPTPPAMHNHGNYIISLGELCRWLAQQAENLGVDIFPGFAAADLIIDENNCVRGVITGDMGRDKHGQPTAQYQPGMALYAQQTLFAEGCRGSLSQRLIKHYQLRDDTQSPQTYAIGIKELWEIDPAKHAVGTVVHSVGWPLDNKTYGGSFVYHLQNNLVSVGLVIGLDYQNPYLNPFEEMQRFKTHPAIKPIFENGRRICYGARALNEGGLQAVPQLYFPGGLLIGCSAGYVNVPKIKGNHTAMKSGMVAAETVFNAIKSEVAQGKALQHYQDAMQQSWIWPELQKVRNIRPAFARWGLLGGMLYAALDTYILRGKAPWTLHHHADHLALKPAQQYQPIDYPKPDGTITFDRLSSVFLSNTNHAENQPCHLTLQDEKVPIDVNFNLYASPETRYCPAGVYEIVYNENKRPMLQINAQNCVHCKTCDIKDPQQNIVWVTPEGGGGPNYPNM